MLFAKAIMVIQTRTETANTVKNAKPTYWPEYYLILLLSQTK
jgi:hypothetical protein